MFRGGAKDSDTAGWLDEMVEVYLHVDGFMKVHTCMNFQSSLQAHVLPL